MAHVPSSIAAVPGAPWLVIEPTTRDGSHLLSPAVEGMEWRVYLTGGLTHVVIAPGVPEAEDTRPVTVADLVGPTPEPEEPPEL